MTDQKYKDLMNGGWSYPKKESTDPEEVKKVVDKYLTDNKIDSETINKKITDGVSKIVADAPEDFDTLKEMSDWISEHEDSAAAMNSAILDNKSSIDILKTDKANATDVDALSGEVENNTNAISEIKANITTNIYNLNDVVKGKWITNKNGSAGDSTSWAYLPLKVKGLKTVTISALGGTASWNKHYFNDNNGTTIEYNNSQVTVNVPSDATILYVNIYSEYTDINSIKITTESVGEIVSAINERTTLNVRLKLEQGDINDDGFPVSSTEYKRTINYIKVKPNTEYTILRSNNSNLYVCGFQSKGIAVTDGTGTKNKFIVYESTQTNICFTTTSTTQYIKVIVKNLDLSEKITLDLTNSVGETVADNMNIIDDIGDINHNLDNLSYGEVAGVNNIFKVDTINWTLTDNGIKNNAKNDGYFLGKIKLFAGKTYKISFLLKSKPTVDSSFTAYIDGSVYNACTFAHFNSYALNVKVEKDYTATSDCELLYRLWGNSNSDIFEFQLQVEEGTVATDYKPYIPSVKMLADDVEVINDSLSALGKCKNLLKTTLGSGTGNGITYVNNGNGTYALNGTCTNTFELHFNQFLKLPYGKYKLLGTSAFQKDNNGAWKATLASGDVFEVSESKPVLDVIAYITSGSVVDKTFKPMVTANLNATEDDFVPYTGDGDTLTADVAKIKNDMTWKRVARVTTTSTDDVISVLPDTWKEVMVDVEDTTTISTDNCYARSVFTIYRECVTYNGNNYFRTGYANLVVNITGNHSIKIPEMNSGTAVTIYYRN